MNVLKELLDTRYLVAPKNGVVALIEPNPNAALRCVTIEGLPEETYILKLDGGKLGYFLRDNRGQKKCCDFILAVFWNSRKLLFFVELKSGTRDNSEIKKQFRGGECAIDYCGAILSRFYGVNDFFKTFERRYFLFYRPVSMDKRRTRPKPRSHKPNSADTMHLYPVGHGSSVTLKLRILIG